MNKIIHVFICLLIGHSVVGQGFLPTYINWTLPMQGYSYNSINYSYYDLYSGTLTAGDMGSQLWTTADMDGDGRPDLVVYREMDSLGTYKVPGLPNNAHWKVYLNNGIGFNLTSIQWTLPSGGYIYNSVNYSYYDLNSGMLTVGDIGSQQWSTIDMNGDTRPDLVVRREMDNTGYYNVQGLPSSAHWEVYLNNGTGFNSTPISWTLPAGGYIYNSVNYSYYDLNSGVLTAGDIGSQEWTTMDMNGDFRLDLVVRREKDNSGYYNVQGLPSSAYWEVYLNNGTGFNSTPISWTLPVGGYIYNSVNYSYYDLNSGILTAGDIGSQEWTTIDMNGDYRPDLVVRREKDNSGYYNVQGLPSNAYWEVYLNNGTGFNLVSTQWTLPSGGYIYNSVNYSYYDLNSGILTAGDIGSQEWTTIDMNGDFRPDLVVRREKDNSGYYNVPGLPSNAHWEVHFNNGTSFNAIPVQWTLPMEGYVYNSVNYSYYDLYSGTLSAGDDGSQLWTTRDMNGDAAPDLVAYREAQGGTYGVLGRPNAPYWKVYLNNTVTGISENFVDNSNLFKLYPNPNTGAFIFETVGELESGTNLIITDIIGSIIYQQNSINNQELINLELAQGIYIYKIVDSNQKIIGTGKFLCR